MNQYLEDLVLNYSKLSVIYGDQKATNCIFTTLNLIAYYLHIQKIIWSKQEGDTNTMSNQIQPTTTKLFTEISEYEQETATGGLSFSFSQTEKNILSYANSQISISKGDTSISSNQTSLYSLSQKTTSITIDFGDNYCSPVSRIPALRLLGLMFLRAFSS